MISRFLAHGGKGAECKCQKGAGCLEVTRSFWGVAKRRVIEVVAIGPGERVYAETYRLVAKEFKEKQKLKEPQ